MLVSFCILLSVIAFGFESKPIEAVFLPTLAGYPTNTGVISPPFLQDHKSSVTLTLKLDSQVLYVDRNNLLNLRIMNNNSELPIPVGLYGSHLDVASLRAYVAIFDKDGTMVTRCMIQEPEFIAWRRPNSSIPTCAILLDKLEWIDLPIVIHTSLKPGEYEIAAHLEVGTLPKSSYVKRKCWTGVAQSERVSMNVRVIEKEQTVPSARFVSTGVKGIVKKKFKRNPAQEDCRLDIDETAIERGSVHRGTITLRNHDWNSTIVYSPAQWHRTLASLSVNVIWSPQKKKTGNASKYVVTIEDPFQLGPIDVLPLEILDYNEGVEIPFEFTSPPNPGKYDVSVEIKSPHFIPLGPLKSVEITSNELTVLVR